MPRLIAWSTVVLLSYPLFGVLDFQYFPLKQFWTLTKHQILKFECAKLHALRALMPMHLTHHWYVPYAPAHLHAKPIINMHLTYHLYVPAHLYPHQYMPWDKLSTTHSNFFLSLAHTLMSIRLFNQSNWHSG